jgi:hypothetical protein
MRPPWPGSMQMCFHRRARAIARRPRGSAESSR